MILFHGTTKQDLRFLEPYYYGGSNGSLDGVGINLTDSLAVAQEYGKGGRVLLLSPSTTQFLRVDTDTMLSPAQSATLSALFKELPFEVQIRFATDLHGKQTHHFTEESAAKSFYSLAKAELAGFHLPDRIRPEVQFERDTVDVLVARRDVDFSAVNTKRLHYILNLYDNRLATTMLKEITTGLVLPKDSGTTVYLSFRRDEMVLADFAVEDTLRPEFTAQLASYSALTGQEWLSLHREHESPTAVAQALQRMHAKAPPPLTELLPAVRQTDTPSTEFRRAYR